MEDVSDIELLKPIWKPGNPRVAQPVVHGTRLIEARIVDAVSIRQRPPEVEDRAGPRALGKETLSRLPGHSIASLDQPKSEAAQYSSGQELVPRCCLTGGA